MWTRVWGGRFSLYSSWKVFAACAKFSTGAQWVVPLEETPVHYEGVERIQQLTLRLLTQQAFKDFHSRQNVAAIVASGSCAVRVPTGSQ